MSQSIYTLKIQCPDAKGIVAQVAGFLSNLGGNILDLDQHTALDLETFFLRLRFEVEDHFVESQFVLEFKPLASNFQMSWDLIQPSHRPQVALMVSKTEHCLFELLTKHRDGQLNCDIPVIISNHPDRQDIADMFDIPFFHCPIIRDIDSGAGAGTSMSGKAQQEVLVNEILENHKTDYVVMARYMQILSDEFTTKWDNKVINIHHGFLPAFVGAKPYHQAWTKGVKMIGATAHYATSDLDQGPIISQDTQRVADKATIEDFIEMGQDIERRVLFDGLKKVIENRVFVAGNRTFIL
jgi:formyltetrahydrofolate deformylase